MPEIKRATVVSALAAARKKWGKFAYIRENKRACTAKEREANIQKARTLSHRSKEIDDRLNKLDKTKCRNLLVDAARFVVDVNGDPPSIENLKKPLADINEYIALEAEWLENRRERESIDTHSYRWSVVVERSIYCNHITAEADSLPELIEKIQRKES